jgi:hypothetical protein
MRAQLFDLPRERPAATGPTRESAWILRGSLLAGAFPDASTALVLPKSVDCVVTLNEEREYSGERRRREDFDTSLERLFFPIEDGLVPCDEQAFGNWWRTPHSIDSICKQASVLLNVVMG